MMMFLSIALGGAVGAVSRYGVTLAVTGLYGAGFQPVATLLVNAIGSGLMGACYGALAVGASVSDPMRGVLMIGFLGALTTFSSFALDAVVLFEKGEIGLAAGYVLASVAVSLASFAIMLFIVKTMTAGQL